jgi:two-component system cell cycle sensor histidine kinase/response regulator CckA
MKFNREVQSKEGRTGRVLVMDDDILVREVVGKMLRKLGYEPVFAQEGEEALALYAKGLDTGDPFAAVTLDLTIPGGMGGMEAISNIV